MRLNKLDMKTVDNVDENIEKISSIFPNVIVESENGKSIDFDLLKQELSKEIVEGSKEKYQLTWPGKKESIVTANTPSTNTLRPVREKSVDFENTKNIYIEGDNLEALKILQESYLGKIKCIYIDPPYNTGNDFIYKDDFKKSSEEELEESGQIDENGNRMVSNSQSNGKFHSDWLTMMYPRLKLARNLLSEDGVIFISIDGNEMNNLWKICDEIFGENSLVSDFLIIRAEGGGLAKQVIKGHDYLLVYSKNISEFKPLAKPKDIRGKILKIDDEEYWIQEDWLRKEFGKYGNCYYEEVLEYKGQEILDEINDGLKTGKYMLIPKENGMNIVGKLRKVNDDYSKFYSILKHLNKNGIVELKDLGLNNFFSYPKPTSLIKELIKGCTFFNNDRNSIILDFFSGSATTAHAVMQLNADDGGKRKYIMIQLPENVDVDNSFFSTICEIGEERIRRAGKKIKEETNADIDYGFRVYKIDSSNMKDVYYKPNDLSQSQLNLFESNIKEDRTSEDLLTQVMLDLGLTLDLKIEERTILNNKVYYVADNALVACFDDKIDINIIEEICNCNPLKVVFKDSSFNTDKDKINLEEKIKKLSPETEISIL